MEVALCNGQMTITVSVPECDELSGDKDIRLLIGMDVISMGDFCITHEKGETIMSFICPSQKAIDFQKEFADKLK